MTLLSVAEAQARLFALAGPTQSVMRDIATAVGYFAAETVHALRSQPSADLSAMDGYAVRWQDIPGPWTLIGESSAGHPFQEVMMAGQCVRISTGAILPSGSDTIVIQENIDKTGEKITLSHDGPAMCGAHVRRSGFDFDKGTQIIAAGDRITPARIALAILAGYKKILVHSPVKISIIDCGDELVAPGEPLLPGQIHASNGAMLAAILADINVQIQIIPTAKDEIESVKTAISSCKNADIIVTTGGASIGDHDLIRPALIELGAQIDFWRVALKPGKPIMAGRLGTAIMLGLPGNPVSAFVTAHLFLLPLIRHLSGASDPFPPVFDTIAGANIEKTGSRAEYLRAYYNGSYATPLENQDSSALRSLADANALIVREPGSPPLDEGAKVVIQLI